MASKMDKEARVVVRYYGYMCESDAETLARQIRRIVVECARTCGPDWPRVDYPLWSLMAVMKNVGISPKTFRGAVTNDPGFRRLIKCAKKGDIYLKQLSDGDLAELGLYPDTHTYLDKHIDSSGDFVPKCGPTVELQAAEAVDKATAAWIEKAGRHAAALTAHVLRTHVSTDDEPVKMVTQAVGVAGFAALLAHARENPPRCGGP